MLRHPEAARGLLMAFRAEKAMDRAAKAKSPKLDLSGKRARVREIFFAEDGKVYAKYGLNWKTRKWVKVPELGKYPPECFCKIKEV